MKPPTQEQLSHLIRVNIYGIVLTLILAIFAVFSVLSIFAYMPPGWYKLLLVIIITVSLCKGLRVIKDWIDAEMKEYRAYREWLTTRQ